jgi:hypothetical protein
MVTEIFDKPLRITLLLITLIAASAAVHCVFGSDHETPMLTTIGLEAEQSFSTAPMVINSDASASGDACIASNTSDSGSATFTVDLATDGNYVIWSRVLAPSYYHDSFYVSVDSGPEDVYDIAHDTWSDSWQWTRVNGRADNNTPLTLNPRIFELSAGIHEIVFRAREPDTKLDRLIITNNLSFVPDDSGPPTPTPLPAAGRQFYVSPQGRPNGNGSQNNPWDLLTVMGHPPAIRPGDTIYLRGGTYNLRGNLATHISYLTGTHIAPITVRPYPGERAIIDWDYVWLADGAYTNYIGIEWMSSGLRKVYPPEAGGWPDGRPPALNVRGKYIKIINCIIHDIGGTGADQEAVGFELHGNIMYYIGFTSSRTWGTTAYIQNRDGEQIIGDNIMFHQFAHNLQLYGSDAAYVRNITVEGNAMLTPGALGPNRGFNAVVWPGALPAEDIRFIDNFTYSPLVDATNVSIPGANGVLNRNLTVTGNYFLGGAPALRMGQWSPTTFTNNTIYSQYGLVWAWLERAHQYNWNNNSYYYEGTRPDVMFEAYGSFHQSFAAWKQVTGLDQNSTFQSGRVPGTRVFVRPNKYEQGRAHIMVVNFDMQDSAIVDLREAGLRIGQSYEIRDAQNYFGVPVTTGTYYGGTVSIPLNLTTITPIIGAGLPINAGLNPVVHTSKEFNAFVVLPR